MTTLRNLRLQIPNNIPDSQLPMEFGRQLVKHLMSMEAGLSSNPSNDANTNSGQSITGHSNQIQLPQTILSRGMGDDSVRFGETLSNSDKSGLTLIQLPSSSNDQNQSPQFVIRPVSTSNTFANPFATNSVQIPVFDLHPYIVDKPESSLADALNKEEPAESKEINLMSSLFSLANSADKSDASAFRYRYFPSKTQSSSSSASSAESALVPVSSSSLSPSLSFLNQSDSPILLLEQLRR